MTKIKFKLDWSTDANAVPNDWNRTEKKGKKLLLTNQMSNFYRTEAEANWSLLYRKKKQCILRNTAYTGRLPQHSPLYTRNVLLNHQFLQWCQQQGCLTNEYSWMIWILCNSDCLTEKQAHKLYISYIIKSSYNFTYSLLFKISFHVGHFAFQILADRTEILFPSLIHVKLILFTVLCYTYTIWIFLKFSRIWPVLQIASPKRSQTWYTYFNGLCVKSVNRIAISYFNLYGTGENFFYITTCESLHFTFYTPFIQWA